MLLLLLLAAWLLHAWTLCALHHAWLLLVLLELLLLLLLLMDLHTWLLLEVLLQCRQQQLLLLSPT